MFWRRKYLSFVIEVLFCSEAGKHDPIVFEHVFKKSYSRLLQVVQHVEVGGYKIKARNVNERFFYFFFSVFSDEHKRCVLCPTSSIPDYSFSELQLLCIDKQ